MSQPALFTVESLNQQIRANVIGVLHYEFKSSQRQVVVQGQIGEIRPTPYRFHYNVRLKGESGQTVYLDIERDLVTRTRAETGDYVEVVGLLSVYDGQNHSSKIDIRIVVSSLIRIRHPQNFVREERATLEFVKSLGHRRSELPDLERLRISLIHPKSELARVQDDFQRQLSDVQRLVQIDCTPVAINKIDAIAAAIQNAPGDVVVLIRGGSSDLSDFDVFDAKPVLQAWASKSAYKAVGLGHEGTGAVLIEFISDFVGSTPTAVGGFLAQQILRTDQRRKQAIASHEHQVRVEEQKRTLELALASAEEHRAIAVQQAAEAAKRTRDRLIITAAFIVGILFVLGFLLGYRLAR